MREVRWPTAPMLTLLHEAPCPHLLCVQGHPRRGLPSQPGLFRNIQMPITTRPGLSWADKDWVYYRFEEVGQEIKVDQKAWLRPLGWLDDKGPRKVPSPEKLFTEQKYHLRWRGTKISYQQMRDLWISWTFFHSIPISRSAVECLESYSTWPPQAYISERKRDNK